MPLATHLTAVDVSLLNSEIHELIDTLLFRFGQLEKVSDAWVAANQEALRTMHISDPESRDAFDRALVQQRSAQSDAFLTIEAFLAAWARLSLLFFPIAKDAKRQNRGDVLRAIWLVEDTSPLADRDLRNAWMHFDERMDNALEARTIGNRQKFTTATDGAKSASYSLRVVEMDSLVVWYRDQTDRPRSTNLRELCKYLEVVDKEFRGTQDRFRSLTGITGPQ